MRKLLFLIPLLLFGAASVSAQNQTPVVRAGMVIRGPLPAAVGSAAPVRPASLLAAVVFDSARVVSELNQSTFGENYPWFSTDGLRLFYCRIDPFSAGVWVASRPSLHAPFGTPVSVGGTNDIVTFYLSADERDIWYFKNGSPDLWHATRATPGIAFNAGIVVALLNVPASVSTTNTPYRPNFSISGAELFITYVRSMSSSQVLMALMRFERLGPDMYSWVEEVLPPPGFYVGPAHLDDQDRRLIFCADTIVPSFRTHLFERRRPTTTAPFGPPRAIRVPSAAPGYYEGAAFYHAASDQLVYSRVTDQSWLDGDLWIASHSRGLVGLGADITRVGGLRLAPNPATTTVRLIGASAGLVELLDGLGRTVRTVEAAGGERDVNLSVEGLPAGLYIVRAGQQARRLVVE